MELVIISKDDRISFISGIPFDYNPEKIAERFRIESDSNF